MTPTGRRHHHLPQLPKLASHANIQATARSDLQQLMHAMNRAPSLSTTQATIPTPVALLHFPQQLIVAARLSHPTPLPRSGSPKRPLRQSGHFANLPPQRQKIYKSKESNPRAPRSHPSTAHITVPCRTRGPRASKDTLCTGISRPPHAPLRQSTARPQRSCSECAQVRRCKPSHQPRRERAYARRVRHSHAHAARARFALGCDIIRACDACCECVPSSCDSCSLGTSRSTAAPMYAPFTMLNTFTWSL